MMVFLFFLSLVLTFSSLCLSEQRNMPRLINHWPMSNLSDVVGGADLYDGFSYSFVADSFGNPNQAISFNNGYLKAPPGTYFSGDFTITLWVYLRAFNVFTQIIDFGNGQFGDNVMLGLAEKESQIRVVVINSDWSDIYSPYNLLSLNQWYYVAVSLNGNNGHIYVNGVLTGLVNYTGNSREDYELYKPSNVKRTSNFIGTNSWNDSYADAIYDDLKIYTGAMTEAQICADFNSSKIRKIIIFFLY